MAEEENDILVTPERSVSADSSLRNSTGKTSASSSRKKIIPQHYLRASTGSCHDFCKYGWRHTFEAKRKSRIPKRVRTAVTESVYPLSSATVWERKKKPSFKLRPFLDSKSQLPNISEIIKRVSTSVKKKEASSKQVLSPAKKTGVSPRQASPAGKIIGVSPRQASSVVKTVEVSPRQASPAGKIIGASPRRASSVVKTVEVSPRQASPAGKIIGVSPRRASSVVKTLEVSPRQASPAGKIIGVSPRRASSVVKTVEVLPRQASPAGKIIGVFPRRASSVVKTVEVSPRQAYPAIKTIEVSPKHAVSPPQKIEVSPQQDVLPAKKIEVSPKQAVLPAKKFEISPRQSLSSTRKIESSPKQARPSARKIETSPKKVVSPAKKLEAPAKESWIPAKKGNASPKPGGPLKPKSTGAKPPLPSGFSGSMGGKRNGDPKMVKKMATSKIDEKEALRPPIASVSSKPSASRVVSFNTRKYKKIDEKKALRQPIVTVSPKPSFRRVLSLNTRKYWNVKALPPPKSQNKVKKAESKVPSPVKEKTLYVIEESGSKSMELAANGTHITQSSPSSSFCSSSSESSLLDNRESESMLSKADNSISEDKNQVETLRTKDKKSGRGAVHPENTDCAFQKLKFRRGSVVTIQTENNGPRRLKFRRARVLGDYDGKGGIGRRSFRRRRDGDTDSAKPESAKVVLRHQDVQGKKDTQVLFNNVIEETASKLVQTRKGKVKALVGAFETVISLQEGKPSST